MLGCGGFQGWVARILQQMMSMHRSDFTVYRVTTCLENLEMSGDLTAVREMSGILLKVREVSGIKSRQRKVA